MFFNLVELVEKFVIEVNCDMLLFFGCKNFYESIDKLKVKFICVKVFIDYW